MARATTYVAKNLRASGEKTAPATVTVEPLGEGRYAVTVDGHRHELDSLLLPHGAVSMIIEGRSHSVELEEHGDEIAVLVGGQVSRFDVVDERRQRQRSQAGAFQAEGKQVIAAPMPGKIVKVLVKVGEAVTEGQGLVVMEAMKMENELKSPKAGTVTEVLAKEGATVENGTKLAVVE